jgi:uncharacterized membrane protein YqjE
MQLTMLVAPYLFLAIGSLVVLLGVLGSLMCLWLLMVAYKAEVWERTWKAKSQRRQPWFIK